MDGFTSALILLAMIGGFIGGTLLSRSYWQLVYRRYTNEMTKQYVFLLNKFGLRKNSSGVWEMSDENGTWFRQDK